MHYRHTNQLLQIPIFISLNSQTWSIVACFCMLIHIDRSKFDTMSFLLTTMMFIFFKLSILLSFGNFVVVEYSQLVWHIRVNIRNWSPLDWINMHQLDGLKKKFEFTLFSIFTIEQALVSTLIGFIFHYLAILLQTSHINSPL